MAGRATWPLIVAGVATAMSARAQIATLPLPGTEAGIVVAPGAQTEPALSSPSGSFVAYTDLARTPSEVWYCRLQGLDCPGSQVPPSAGNQFAPAVADDLLVYVDEGPFGPRRGNVVLMSITQGSSVQVSPFAAYQGAPAVSARLVAWEDDRSATTGRDVRVHDVLMGGEWSITGAGSQHGPRASGTLVSYLDDAAGAVEVYDLATGLTTVAYPAQAVFADVDGSAVVVQTLGGDVEVWSTDGRPLAALALPGLQSNPHLSGDWVAFQDYSTLVSRVIVWNWKSGDLYAPPAGTSTQTLNDVAWPRVAYVDDRTLATREDIYLYDTSADGGTDGGADGGTDGGVDGGPDGGTDGGADGGVDGGTDGGADGGVDGGADGGVDGGADGGAPARCDDPSAVPLSQIDVLRENAGPDARNIEFTSKVEIPVLVCVDAQEVSSAWVLLDDEAVARPNDFNMNVVHVERRRSVPAGPNRLGALVAGKPGARLAVRLLPDPAGGPAPVAGAALKGPGPPRADPMPAQGCSGGAAGLGALVPLAAWLLAPRRRRS